MSTDPKQSPEALLASLQRDVEADELLQKLEAMTDEELDAELAKDGVTPAKQAELAARARAATKKTESAKVVDIRSRRRWPTAVGWASLGFAAAAAAVLVLNSSGAITVAIGGKPLPSATYTAVGAGDPASVRGEAAAACDQEKWAECLAKLNEARASDPAGDSKPSVQDLRRRIAAATNH